MDVDSKPIVSTSTGKRKRNGERRAPPNVTRASTRAASRTSRFSTPVPRATKQLRNLLTTSASRSSSKSATRVFALWRFDGHYYSGTVHSIQTSPTCKFRIKFDDGTEEHVDISQLRRCEVKPGDNVLVGKSKATVSDTNGGITVEIDDGGGEVTSEEVDFADLRIAGRSLMKQWDDRILSVDSIVPMIKPKVKMSPSPSKASIASGSSINRGRSRVLGKTAFVVTLSTGNEHWEQDKQKAIRVIQNNGGTVLEDWTSIFAIDGKHSQTNHRWVVEPKDVKVKPKGNIDRVFLVSDHFNQKPKFLIALALGIPCVSTKWLDDIEEVRTDQHPSQRSEEWQPYLLPAGFCETLGAPVSQLVDLNWGNSPDYITDIMTNAVASKLFAHKSVVCIDATYVPLPKSKVSSSIFYRLAPPSTAFLQNSDGQEASRNVPRIILAMGAERVEAVTERKYVSDPTFESFDYVVMRDGCNLLDDLPEDAACVHLNWVKECLIAGRILPIPLD
ncbi:hypothetical protein PLICRDRAFT_110707 [Plicaturopsis crispa FD-325 SS-3]|nr:hypothetical protein PLICRDRAFT_110707 [Plicaturopsis crispa FD-325 SS-3]